MSKSLFKKFSSKARGAFGAPKTARRQRTRLGVESLESRQLFSTAIVGGDSFTQGTGSAALSSRSILGIAPGSTAATATAVGSDQGHVYQLTGTSIQVQATSTNDAFGIVFFDGDHGGVLVEFAGQGLVTVSLDTTLPSFAEGISAPTPGYSFISSQGLAAINVEGASANGSIRITEINNSLDTAPLPAAGTTPTANEVANIRSLSFTDTPSFNSILAADAIFSANSGSVGILAGNTNVTTAVRVGNIDAAGSAQASLAFGAGSTFANVEVYGGNLINDNGSAILQESSVTSSATFSGYVYGVEGLPGTFTNELGLTASFSADSDILNANFSFGVSGISLPNSATTFTIDDSTTQTTVDGFFNSQTFNSPVVIDIKTTDGTIDGLTIGDGFTAFDGGLTILDSAATAAAHGTIDGNLLTSRINSLTIGTAANPIDLDGAVISGFENENGRIGTVTIFGDVGNLGGIAGAGGLGNVTVHGNVYGVAPTFLADNDAKFETLGTTTGLTADIGMITIDGHVNLTPNGFESDDGFVGSSTNPFTGGAIPVLVNVAADAFGGSDAGGTLKGLSVGGAAGTAAIPAAFDGAGIHDVGRILFTVDSSKPSGSITINDTTSIDFGGVFVENGAPSASGLGAGGALIGDISVNATGAASDLRLTGSIGGPTPFGLGVGPTTAALGKVSLTAGNDLTLGADIGDGITSTTYALTSSDTAAGGTPTTAGLLLSAGGDITNLGFVGLFDSAPSLPGIVVEAGGNINLFGDLGDSVTRNFGTLYFSAGENIEDLPATLQTSATGIVTARTGSDVQIIAGGNIDSGSVEIGVLPGAGVGGTAFNNITVSTGATASTPDFNETLTPPVGGDIQYDSLFIQGATAGLITFNVDSAGHLGALDLDSDNIRFSGAVAGVNANAQIVNLANGGDIIAGSIGSLQLGGAGNQADINFIGGGADTAFILVDDGTSKIDAIGAITVRGFLNGAAATAGDFEIQAGSIGDINISTDLTPPAPGAIETAITNFGVLANNYRATAGDFNTYGGTGETLGTVTMGTANLSKLTSYTIGAINITAAGAGVTEGSSVFSGENTFMALGGIHGATGTTTATNGITINTGTSTTRLFDNTFATNSDAYFVAGDGDNVARDAAAAYSIGGAALGDTPINTAGTAVLVAIGDVNITAEGTQPTNVLGISSESADSPGLAILSAVHNPAPVGANADGPIQGQGGGVPLTTATAPLDDLDSAPNNAFIQGSIGNVNIRSLTMSGPAAGTLLPVSDQTPRPVTDFSAGGMYPLGAIAATTSIGTVQGIATLVFPSILNGDSAVQVGVDTATPPRTLTEESILVYLV